MDAEQLLNGVDLVQLVGTLKFKGTYSKGPEWCGSCPLPGCSADSDGFLVWPSPPSGRPSFWCRRCERSGDAVDFLVARDGLSKMAAFRQLGADWDLLHSMNASFKTMRDLGAGWADLVRLGADRGLLKWLGAPEDVLQGLPAAPERAEAVLSGARGQGSTIPRENVAPEPPEPVAPPSDEWQHRALTILYKSHLQLWSLASDAGDGWGLAELRRRGFEDDTIHRAELGEIPKNWRDKPESWGLDGGKKVWIPRGILIPWMIGGDLWRVRIRRRNEDVKDGGPKYINTRGCSNGLYLADGVRADRPAIIVEGELDALTILQVAGDYVAPVATGGTTGARRLRWVATLAKAPLVLVAFDADEAGDDAARWWVQALPMAKRWRPFWGDANQMALDGASLTDWINAGIAFQ